MGIVLFVIDAVIVHGNIWRFYNAQLYVALHL